jgi:DnaK suppressor protein
MRVFGGAIKDHTFPRACNVFFLRRALQEKLFDYIEVGGFEMSEEMRGILLKMRDDLIKEISSKAKTESVEVTNQAIGDIYDQATSERDRELNLLIGDRDREKLAEIDDALERITEGAYGICEECGLKIPKERLKIMPFAHLCVTCKSKHEKVKNLERSFREEREYRKLAFTSSEEEENP